MAVAQIDNINISLVFGRPPLRSAGFGNVVLVRAGITLNGDRTRTYTAPSAVLADRAANRIDDYTRDTVLLALQQRPRIPARVLRVDLAALPTPETYPGVITAYLDSQAGADAFAFVLDTDSLAIVTAVANALAARDRIHPLGIDTDDVDPATTYATLAGQRLLSIDYNQDNDTDYNQAYIAMCARLAFNQDEQTPNFSGPLAGVQPSDANISQTALNALVADNVNVVAPRAPFTAYRYPGRQFSGLPTTVLVSAAWLQVRLSEAISRLFTGLDADGEQLPLDPAGQDQVQGVIEAVLQTGQGLRKVGGYLVEPLAIDENDIALQQMRFDVSAQLLTPTATITVNLVVTQLPLGA